MNAKELWQQWNNAAEKDADGWIIPYIKWLESRLIEMEKERNEANKKYFLKIAELVSLKLAQEEREASIALTADRDRAASIWIEFGYKQCEKGNNLQMALQNAAVLTAQSPKEGK